MSSLHITNGDCAAGTLRSFLTDPVLVTCDVLHEGPAPLVDDDVWYQTRARFLTDGFGARFEATRASLAAFDRTVVDAASGGRDDVVLWFEHDLFDQLLLIRTLDVIRQPDNVSMICIGEFPGVERFIGLGQLNAEQLASLYPARQPVSSEQIALARRAWRAFRAEDPQELFGLMTVETRVLPFLGGAIQRLFEEYPSTANGLSRSGAAILRALQAAPLDGIALFPRTQLEEARPFMGDTCLFDIVRSMAAAAHPLVTLSDTRSQDLRGRTVSITDTGRDVLAGRRDAVALNGIDEWRGGVHLAGRDRSPWRWDAHAKRLVS